MMDQKLEMIKDYYEKAFRPDGCTFEVFEDEIQVKTRGSSQTIFLYKECIIDNKTHIVWIENWIAKHTVFFLDKEAKTVWKEYLPGRTDIENKFEFISFCFIEDHLFTVYQGDWSNYWVYTIKNRVVKYLWVHGEALRIFKDFLTFEDYGIDAPVYKLKIPELDVVDILTRQEAELTDLRPNSDVYWNPELNDYYLEK